MTKNLFLWLDTTATNHILLKDGDMPKYQLSGWNVAIET